MDVYQEVTQKIVELLEEEAVTWKRSWSRQKTDLKTMPNQTLLPIARWGVGAIVTHLLDLE